MNHSPVVVIIESDPNAIAQMRRVLAGMGMRALAVSTEDELRDMTATLLRGHRRPALIVARVALPGGSGIRMLQETAAIFPGAQQMLISHHPRKLLSTVPGFLEYSANFLQAEFRDDQFRSAVERALARGRAAS